MPYDEELETRIKAAIGGKVSEFSKDYIGILTLQRSAETRR